ncbi:MAG: response regulator [candidate division KSB1 bacterium]|nr:response regulator [candidate division KSB1 bacterium]
MTNHILLIDDDVDFVEMNKTFLETKGYTVDTAYNGTEGVERVKESAPNLIVLDVMMDQVGEGFEVARTLKQDEQYKHIPIIMLTSVNKEHGFDLTVGADEQWNPVDCFLEKPLSPQDLLAKVREFLSE